MSIGWWSPVRMVDGSARARHNAERALRETITQREQEQLAVRRFERDYAARPMGEILTQIRRSAGLG